MEHLEDRISVSLINLPAHRFLHIKNYDSQGYNDFWEKQEGLAGQDCDTISRLLDDLEGKLDGDDQVKGRYRGQVMARIFEEKGTPEAYGVRLPLDWQGQAPPAMQILPVEATDYVVFEHGPFDFEKEGDQVYRILERAMDAFSYEAVDFVPDISTGRVAYFFFDPDLYAKYLLPVRAKHG